MSSDWAGDTGELGEWKALFDLKTSSKLPASSTSLITTLAVEALLRRAVFRRLFLPREEEPLLDFVSDLPEVYVVLDGVPNSGEGQGVRGGKLLFLDKRSARMRETRGRSEIRLEAELGSVVLCLSISAICESVCSLRTASISSTISLKNNNCQGEVKNRTGYEVRVVVF